MNAARLEKLAQEKYLTAKEYEAVDEHHKRATEVSSAPKKLSASWQRPNTCDCDGSQAAAQEEEPVTISSVVLTKTDLKFHTILAAELTAHGVEVTRDDGKLLRKADLRKLADKYLVGKGAYVLTVTKSAAKPTMTVPHFNMSRCAHNTHSNCFKHILMFF